MTINDIEITETEPDARLEMRRKADANLRNAIQWRGEVAAKEAHAKDQIAFLRGELVKAERALERWTTELPGADGYLREAMSFYRWAMEQGD